MRRSPPTRPGFLIAAIAIAAALLVSATSAQSLPSIQIVAVDANPSGNTATSLGPLNACVQTESGQQVVVDLVVDAVPGPPETNGVISFQVRVDYPSDILEVTDVDYEFFLGASGSFEPLEFLMDDLPDRDGRFTFAIADLAVNAPTHGANVEEGRGVLARLTLNAKSQGVGTVAPAIDPSESDPGRYDAYPALFSNQNLPYQVETVGGALVAVGQDCPVPPESTPAVQQVPPLDEGLVTGAGTPTATPAGSTPESTPSPTVTTEPAATPTAGPTAPGDDASNVEEGDGGTSAGTIAVVAGLALAGAGLALGGGYMLLSQRGRRNAGHE